MDQQLVMRLVSTMARLTLLMQNVETYLTFWQGLHPHKDHHKPPPHTHKLALFVDRSISLFLFISVYPHFAPKLTFQSFVVHEELQLRRLVAERGANNDARRRSRSRSPRAEGDNDARRRSRSRSHRAEVAEDFVYTRRGVSISYAHAEEMLHRLNARNPENLQGLSECLIVGPPPALLVPLPLDARWQAALEGVEDNHESEPDDSELEADASEPDEQDEQEDQD